jgi:hypothetical protein
MKASLGKEPIMLDKLNEDEDQHYPFEFLNDDDISFPRLLFDLTVW